MATADAPADAEQALADEWAACYADPLRFVRFAFPWGEPGPLRDYDGPDTWQADVLRDIGQAVRQRRFDGHTAVPPIRLAVASGHGIGKSALSAWIAWWILCTRPYSQGTVTANTIPQLETKTWAAIQRWGSLCVARHWFDVTSQRVRAKAAPDAWFCAALASREENSEAFAGQHAASSTSWYLFDEASAITDRIWDVAEGGLSDGEPMIFAFGNPTRTSGRFHAACFGAARDRWAQRIIDSRECRFPNKDLIAEWERDYGEDSDFFRVRVRGLPPRASDTQFIASDLVFQAQQRDLVPPFGDEPLIVGLDVARGGGDVCVFRFRRGRDARSIPAVKLLGEESRDSMRLVSLAADVLSRTYRAPTWPERDGVKPAILCIDATGVGGPIADRLKQLGHKNVVQVQFGGASPEPQCENMRAAIWARLREWLEGGCIDRDPHLEADLTSIGYGHNKRDKLVLESKESMKRRGVDSPDHADALALTFAVRAASVATLGGKPAPRPVFAGYPSGQGWMA